MASTEERARKGTWDEKDLEKISGVLEKFGLNQPDFSTESQLNAVCLMLSEAVLECAKQKDELSNVQNQLGKESQTNDALQKLITALKTQIALTREEGELKLKEETQKRIDCSQQFQNTVNELGQLMEKQSDQNSKLKDENKSLANNMTELIKQCEAREENFTRRATEYDLQMKLYHAQLNKAKIEKAELSADFTRERLTLHKKLLQDRQEQDIQLNKNDSLKEELEEYKSKCAAIEKDIGNSSTNFNQYRQEMDKLGRKLRKVELEMSEWREKSQAGAEQIKKMNQNAMEKQKEMDLVNKKLLAMEKLNRVLQEERTKLLAVSNK